MKKTKIWLRILALCLALVCTFSLAAAAAKPGDQNGDDIVNVWDLQMVKDSTAAEKTSVLSALLGGGDELHPNGEGIYEIYSALGLYNMANLIKAGTEANTTFKLMNDIDMQGAAWQTTKTFDGIFEGDGKVISNVNVHGELKLDEDDYAAGFFGKIGRSGVVRNLKLENVTNILTTESKANFIGLLTGTITGEVNNCTTVGTVIDPRTTLPKTAYIGTLAGRVAKDTENPVVGITIDDESILMTAESAAVAAISGKSQKVLCKMGMDFGVLSYPEGTAASEQYGRVLGIAGYAPDYTNFQAYNWQDISGACTVEGGTGKTYDLVDPILTARRQATVDKMYEICTIPWTPSQDMTLYNYEQTGTNGETLDYGTKTWKAGTTYYGMPYNHGSGSLERFKSCMEEVDGLLTVKKTVPTEAYYYKFKPIRDAMSAYTDTTLTTELTYTYPDTGVTYDLLPGFKLEDQPMQVGETVKSCDHAGFNRYMGNDCSQAIAWAWREAVSSDVANGGTVICGVSHMAPTVTYQSLYGVRPVGNLVPSEYSVPAWDAMYTAAGKDGFMNAYAQASRGDGLIVEQTAGGHSRLIAYDPICIHRYDTAEDGKVIDVIDAENSYLITHEQGGLHKPNVNTTCHWDRVLSFETLTSDSTHGTGTNGSECKHYMPMTLPAFHDVDSKAAASTVTYQDGVVKSNFVIVSTEVDGNEVFTAVTQHRDITPGNTWVGEGYREAHIQEDMVKTHGDLAGKTIKVRLSNGDVHIVDADTGVLSKEALDGKKVIFLGNSRTYYGKCVLDKGQSVFSQADRTGDKGYFYQVCKANGVDVTVTNFTYGGHTLQDIDSGSCAADRGHDGHNHLEDLTDRNYDYVVLQQGSTYTGSDAVEMCQKLMDIFLEGNPNTKFVFLVYDAVHSADYAWRSSIKELEKAGVFVVDWGALVNDLTTGTTQIPGGTQQCSKYSFIVNKSATDGYHPNVLTGYITAQMLFCALTGESAQGMDYSFWNDTQVNKAFDLDKYMETYYAYDATVDSNTNFVDIFNSEADMAGIQQLIDQYLEAKAYRNY